jgi:hypothetical protein
MGGGPGDLPGKKCSKMAASVISLECLSSNFYVDNLIKIVTKVYLITCTHVYYRQGIGISTIPLLKYYIA